MADPFGISFSPSDQSGGNGQPQNGQRPTPVQQAIQTLSLRIPRVVGAGGIAPTPLLTSAGGSGLGGDPNSAAILEQLKRYLFGNPAGQSGGGFSPAPPPAAAPGPLDALSNMFPTPGAGTPAPEQTSGSGAPLGGESGSGAPLPEPDPTVPLPKFDYKDYRPLNREPAPMPTPIDRPDRGGRGV